ncbi:FAD-binding domain-containing protein [Byssothecium circinans]|uniref:FAD-binding domain-containing protein n=1 Tax=Byssothecium circinans TaxID=147558 RepID=A0A6A5TJS7_9PLEO|nr:FAD-binding domain-containing protein [Byssothecium circinans]
MDTDDVLQCDQLLAAGLQDLVLLRDSAAYVDREASYWATNAALHPECIVQPRSTADVSRVVKILAKSSGLAALRSGGHTQWTGSNDISNGVTIDLGRMKNVTYNAQTKLASVQPGPRWGDVYETLLGYGVCVVGGRDGNVGIGGYLTGGGNSYYTGRYGWGIDNVANFEVVLADGSIVNANPKSHSDLFKALKGGSGNFGIVTRFDLYTFPAKDVWGGIRAAARDQGDALAQAMVDFTNTNNKNPEAAFIINYTFNPGSSSDILVAHVVIDTDGVVNAPAFAKVQQIPVILNDVKNRSMANMANSYLLPGDEQQVWFSLSFKNDVRVIKKAGLLHDELVEELKTVIPSGSFSTQCLFQPVPTFFTERSLQRGGNVLGLDNEKQNALMWLITGATKTVEHQAIMREKLTTFYNDLNAYATSLGLGVAWQHLNYADQTQDPLKSYGAKNIAFIRKVAATYDPSQVFQKKVVSGWKISKVGA